MCLAHIQFWGPVCADPIFGALSLGMPLSSSYMVHFWKVIVKGLDSATCYQILINFDTSTMKIRAHQCSTFEGIVFWVLPTVKAKDSDRFCTVSARVSSAAIKCSLRAEETCRRIKFCKRNPWYNLIFDTVSLSIYIHSCKAVVRKTRTWTGHRAFGFIAWIVTRQAARIRQTISGQTLVSSPTMSRNHWFSFW